MKKKSRPSRKRKQTKRQLVARLRRGNTTDRLYAAVIDYLEDNGGGVATIGGIQTIQDLTDSRHNFKVAIKVCGTPPNYATK